MADMPYRPPTAVGQIAIMVEDLERAIGFYR